MSKRPVPHVLSGMGEGALLARSLGAYVWEADAFHEEIVRHVPFGPVGGAFPATHLDLFVNGADAFIL